MNAIRNGFVQMREVSVKREELLSKMRENRATHIKEYNEAVEGFWKTVLQSAQDGVVNLQAWVKKLEAGEQYVPHGVSFSHLVKPQSHEKDYDQAIAMYEMCVDDVVSVRSDEFACYVLDEWDWTQSFKSTNSMYVGSGR